MKPMPFDFLIKNPHKSRIEEAVVRQQLDEGRRTEMEQENNTENCDLETGDMVKITNYVFRPIGRL